MAGATSFWTIGIDAEPAEPLPSDIVDFVLAPAERQALLHLPADGSPWDRIVFSAKEALYKAWSPMRGGAWLGFEDVQAAPYPDGTFRAQFLIDDIEPFPRTVQGRWAVRDGIVATGIALPASGGYTDLRAP